MRSMFSVSISSGRENSGKLRASALALAAALSLSGCQDTTTLTSGRSLVPVPAQTVSLMEQKGSTKQSPMLIRAYKKEAELEIWKMRADGTYAHLKTYPMCRWSGQLGPKKREGDRQVPEGFYSITPGQMNPNSQFYLAFNVGYPNARRLRIGWLFLDDRRANVRDLRHRPRILRRRTTRDPDADDAVSYDRREPGQAPA